MPRTRFPLNVHTEISMANEGVSLRTKKMLLIIVLVFFTAIIAWIIAQFFKNSMLYPLGWLIGICVGIGVSVFVYQHFLVNKGVEAFEDSKANKIYRFFRISVGSEIGEKMIGDIQCSRFSSGEYVIGLSVSVGNMTTAGDQLTESFFDGMFYLCYRQKIRFKTFTIRDDWENSEMRLSYLKRIASHHDSKLAHTLSLIDAHQSEIYRESIVPRIVFLFYVPSAKLNNLNHIANYVNEWKEANQKMSSLRQCMWMSRVGVVKVCCDYLGTKMIDISPLGDKNKKVVLDIRRLLKPYPSESFFEKVKKDQLAVDSNAFYIRKSIYETRGGSKR